VELTESFTWEELPTRDPHTGHSTMAGRIPWIEMFARRAATAAIVFHFSQSIFRIVKTHDTIYPSWYPFDWTVSPFYELVNIAQVTFLSEQIKHFIIIT
jgi:hypothetical protein